MLAGRVGVARTWADAMRCQGGPLHSSDLTGLQARPTTLPTRSWIRPLTWSGVGSTAPTAHCLLRSDATASVCVGSRATRRRSTSRWHSPTACCGPSRRVSRPSSFTGSWPDRFRRSCPISTGCCCASVHGCRARCRGSSCHSSAAGCARSWAHWSWIRTTPRCAHTSPIRKPRAIGSTPTCSANSCLGKPRRVVACAPRSHCWSAPTSTAFRSRRRRSRAS